MFTRCHKVLSFYKKGIHLVAMAKMNKTKYTLVSNSRLYTAKELLRKYRKKCHRSRKLKAIYIKVPVYFGGIRVNLFFVRLGRCNDWKLLLTTDLSLGFNKLMEIYHIRWSIETFFYGKQKIMQSNQQKPSWESPKHDLALHKHFT